LDAITKPEIFDKVPSNTYGLATSVLIAVVAPLPSPLVFCAATNATICS